MLILVSTNMICYLGVGRRMYVSVALCNLPTNVKACASSPLCSDAYRIYLLRFSCTIVILHYRSFMEYMLYTLGSYCQFCLKQV